MNILHLTPDFNYGDGRSYYVYLLLKYFQRAGHNVYLCTNRGDSFDRVTESGIRVYSFTSLSGKTSYLKSVKNISEIINKNHINIVHSHHRYYELLAVSAAKNKKVHTVSTALSLVNKKYFIEYKSDRIIAVSKAVVKMLTESFKLNEKRISLIPNFVDSEEIKNVETLKAAEKNSSAINILSVGRFHKEKNYETLFEAVSLNKNIKTKIMLIGEGEEKDQYIKIAKDKDLDVEFIAPRRNLKEFFELADVCILTSVRDPLPGFMLQSGLYRKPFIGSDVDGISEIIINGTNGLLFQKKNAFELSEKIKIFVNDKKLAAKCAENLSRLVLKNYTETSVIPQIENLYTGFSG